MIDVSVVVCTYNRKELLAQCLTSLLDQTYPKDRYEILVMENNCTDGTSELVQSMAARKELPRLILERVPRQGLSHARNRGMELAKGRFILYIDDDAVARPDWIARMVQVLEDPAVSAAGGTVKLRLSAPRPRWMRERHLSGLSEYVPRHERPYKLQGRPYPVGCNMGFRTETVRQLGGFATCLGRVERELRGGEETELFKRLAANRAGIAISPQAIVEHVIGPDRLTKRYFIRLYHASGMQRVERLGQLAWPTRLVFLSAFAADATLDVLIWILKMMITLSYDQAFHRQLHVVRALAKIQALLTAKSISQH